MARLEHVIARNVAELRRERGWTQIDLAAHMRKVGLTWQTNRVAQIETLRRPVSIIEVYGLCRVLKVPMDRLLTGADEITTPSGSVLPLVDIREVFRA